MRRTHSILLYLEILTENPTTLNVLRHQAVAF